jgi:predicted CoA-binding protein
VNWRENILETDREIIDLLQNIKNIAVLGIKMEPYQPAFYVPEYMLRAGFEIIPVPVYYPDATEILGAKVYRQVADIPGDVDLVNVFRRSNDVPKHVADIVAKKPKAVWMQSGIRHDEAARELAENGIKVVQDACLMVEHRALMR